MIPSHSRALPKCQSSTARNIKENKTKPFDLWPEQVRAPHRDTGSLVPPPGTKPPNQVSATAPRLVRWKGTSSGGWLEVTLMSLHRAGDTATWAERPRHRCSWGASLCRGTRLFTGLPYHTSRLCRSLQSWGKKGAKIRCNSVPRVPISPGSFWGTQETVKQEGAPTSSSSPKRAVCCSGSIGITVQQCADTKTHE